MPPKTKRSKKVTAPFDFERMLRASLGKSIIYYRCRFKQPVEVFDRLDIPTSFEDAVKVIRFTKVHYENKFDDVCEYIPEFVAIRANINKNGLPQGDEWNIVNGYEMYPALYDPITKQVLTTHYLLPEELFYERFDKSREKDVVNAIKQHCSKLYFSICSKSEDLL